MLRILLSLPKLLVAALAGVALAGPTTAQDVVGFRLAIADAQGNPLPTGEVEVGQDFLLQVYARDLRTGGQATGIRSAFLDVEFDDAMLFSVLSGEVQRLELSANASGGNLVLMFEGAMTAPIPLLLDPDAMAVSLQAALEALPSLEPGDVAVTNAPDPNLPPTPFRWEIRFVGARVTDDVGTVFAEASGLQPPGVSATTELVAAVGSPLAFQRAFFTGPVHTNGRNATQAMDEMQHLGATTAELSLPDPEAEYLMMTGELRAEAVGTLTLTPAPDLELGFEPFVFGDMNPVPLDDVDYGSPLPVLVPEPAPDGLAAAALATLAGVALARRRSARVTAPSC